MWIHNRKDMRKLAGMRGSLQTPLLISIILSVIDNRNIVIEIHVLLFTVLR
jgi:hypothetical protein